MKKLILFTMTLLLSTSIFAGTSKYVVVLDKEWKKITCHDLLYVTNYPNDVIVKSKIRFNSAAECESSFALYYAAQQHNSKAQAKPKPVKKKKYKVYPNHINTQWLAKIIHYFELFFNVDTSRIEIKFSDKVHAGALATCEIKPLIQKRVIKVDRKWYLEENTTFGKVFQVVLHELGHCALFKGHTKGVVILKDLVCPKSIMRPDAFSQKEVDKCLMDNWSYYEYELTTSQSSVWAD